MQGSIAFLSTSTLGLLESAPGGLERKSRSSSPDVTFVIRSSRPRPHCDAYEVERTGASRERSIRIGDHGIGSRRSHQANRRTAKWTRDFNRRRPPSPPAISRHWPLYSRRTPDLATAVSSQSHPTLLQCLVLTMPPVDNLEALIDFLADHGPR